MSEALSPTTLIALLRAVAYGWQQELVAQNVQAITDLGKKLYERIRIVFDHFSSVGSGLTTATKAYNDAVNSFESRLLITTRRLKELGAGTDKDVKILQPVETTVRSVPEDDLVANPDPEERGQVKRVRSS